LRTGERRIAAAARDATPKIVLMDGILLTAGNATRNPSAYPIVAERIGDLTGDKEADDVHAPSSFRMMHWSRRPCAIT
jgi:hypothetical protein